MKTDYIYHYSALDLKAGASKEEIHSAFRRLAKLYHPDQDSSTYAAMRYKEIRAAYDVLRKIAKEHPKTDATAQDSTPNYGASPKDYRTVYGKDWCYVDDDKEDDGSSFDYGDLLWEYDQGIKRPKKRLPLSLNNLPDILRISFNQIFGISMVLRVLVVSFWLWNTFTWVGWGSILRITAISCILMSGLLYRYYFPCTPRRLPVSNIIGSLLLAAALGALCTAVTHQTYVVELHSPHVGWRRYHFGSGPIFMRLSFEILMGLLWLWMPPVGLLGSWMFPLVHWLYIERP